ncbi:MAG: malate synthase G, partial [Marinobacter sp.]|nr:malate synthase G [Marinobacter sp.]
MTERVQVGGIQVAKNLYDFVNNEAIPGTGIDADKFWAEFDKIVNELAPRNRELLAKRDAIQEKMDSWNRDHKGQKLDMAEYKS